MVLIFLRFLLPHEPYSDNLFCNYIICNSSTVSKALVIASGQHSEMPSAILNLFRVNWQATCGRTLSAMPANRRDPAGPQTGTEPFCRLEAPKKVGYRLLFFFFFSLLGLLVFKFLNILGKKKSLFLKFLF